MKHIYITKICYTIVEETLVHCEVLMPALPCGTDIEDEALLGSDYSYRLPDKYCHGVTQTVQEKGSFNERERVASRLATCGACH